MYAAHEGGLVLKVLMYRLSPVPQSRIVYVLVRCSRLSLLSIRSFEKGTNGNVRFALKLSYDIDL